MNRYDIFTTARAIVAELYGNAKTSPQQRQKKDVVAQQAQKTHRPQGFQRPPKKAEIVFRGIYMAYIYSFGIRSPVFVKVVRWETGEWVGQYMMELTGMNGVWAEKYYWAYRNGRFVEVKQTGLKGISRRVLAVRP